MAQTRAWSSKQLWSHHPSRCSDDAASQSPVADFSEALWVPMGLTMMKRHACASAPLEQPLSVSTPGALILLPVERPLLDSVVARGHLRLSLVCRSMASWLYQRWVKCCHSWVLSGRIVTAMGPREKWMKMVGPWCGQEHLLNCVNLAMLVSVAVFFFMGFHLCISLYSRWEL